MESTPTFEKPPIVEFVLGVQFSRLTALTSAHYGRFWNSVGGSWHGPRDNPPIPDQFERFGRGRDTARLQLQLEQNPGPHRMTLINDDEDRLLQIQPTRLHLNWRNKGGFYPSYKTLIGEFEGMFRKLESFCREEKLGPVDVNQWEITYVDRFSRGEYWDSPADWGRFLPGLFQVDKIPTNPQLSLESRSVQWGFEIEPQLGLLHVQASLAKGAKPTDDALMLNLTARGPLRQGHTESVRQGLDLGHDVAVDQFLRLVAEETKQSWRPKETS